MEREFTKKMKMYYSQYLYDYKGMLNKESQLDFLDYLDRTFNHQYDDNEANQDNDYINLYNCRTIKAKVNKILSVLNDYNYPPEEHYRRVQEYNSKQFDIYLEYNN